MTKYVTLSVAPKIVAISVIGNVKTSSTFQICTALLDGMTNIDALISFLLFLNP